MIGTQNYTKTIDLTLYNSNDMKTQTGKTGYKLRKLCNNEICINLYMIGIPNYSVAYCFDKGGDKIEFSTILL